MRVIDECVNSQSATCFIVWCGPHQNCEACTLYIQQLAFSFSNRRVFLTVVIISQQKDSMFLCSDCMQQHVAMGKDKLLVKLLNYSSS